MRWSCVYRRFIQDLSGDQPLGGNEGSRMNQREKLSGDATKTSADPMGCGGAGMVYGMF